MYDINDEKVIEVGEKVIKYLQIETENDFYLAILVIDRLYQSLVAMNEEGEL